MTTFKENPGCKFPEVPNPPNMEDYFSALSESVSQILIEPPPVKTVRRTAENGENILNEIDAAVDLLSKYQDVTGILNSLNTKCPLPKVPDKDAQLPE